MTLADLIRGGRKTESVGVATAILAIPATQEEGEGKTVARIATVAVANPGDAKTAGTDAHADLSGVSPEFAARLSAEDLDDIAAGDIPMGTVQAFEAVAIAREAEDLKEHFEERAILEYDAGLPSAEAELEAARITADLCPEPTLPVGIPTSGAGGIPFLAVPGARQGRHGRFPTLWHGHGPRARGR